MSPVRRIVPAKWIRLICLVLFFAVAISSLPVHLKHNGASAQSSGPRRTQGAPSPNLPNLDDARGIEPGTPKIMPPVPATKCRGRDEKCKKAKGKISDNLTDIQDRLLANVGIRSERDYVARMNSGIPALSTLANLIYWPARMISDFPDMSYRDGGGALAESAVKGANQRKRTYGKSGSGEARKEYGYRSGRSLAAAQSVSSVNPAANQTPSPSLLGSTEDGITNTGHPSNQCQIGLSGNGDNRIFSSGEWSSFLGVGGSITAINLKADWSYEMNLSYSVSVGSPGFGGAYGHVEIDYSTNNGGSWASAMSALFDQSNADGTLSPSNSGSINISLPANTPISQIRVRDLIDAEVAISGDDGFSSGNSQVLLTISNIRLEVVTDTTPPVISNVAAGGITTTGATITWTTNENSDSQVEYGTTTSYGQSTTLNPALVTAHSQGLSGLTAGTLYHYRVKSRDAAGNLAVSGDFTFTTAPPPDTTPPVISNIAAGGITTSIATITWATNENSDSQVEYGPTTAYGQSTALNSALVTTHSQGLSGLTAGTLYHYRVKSGDAAGNLAVSGDFTFTTAPDTTPPTVTSFSPAAGAINVNANANVTVIFSEAMNPATVNGSTVELRDPSNALVPATVSYNAASFTATLDPTASLLAGITYTARVRGGGTDPRVKDVAGNALAADVTRTFTTLSWTGWPANLNMALIDLNNRIGSTEEDLLSRNYNWSLPLLSLPGRAGLDLGLSLSLNSLVYTKAGSVIYFDPEQGYPAPGFRLGFPEIRNAFFNTDAGAQSYLLTMPSGRRVELRQINTNVYEAVDSSYMFLTCDPVNSVFVLYTTDGTQSRFVDVTGSGDYKCVQIKDRQGNYMTIGYGSLAEIRTITDTLGRVINFNYDGFNHLNSITQNWGGQAHTWATFAYGTQTIQTNFSGLTLNGTTNGAQESVLTRVGLADGSVYSFEYNSYCQVKTVRRYAPNNSNPVNFPGDYFQRAYTTYGLPINAADPQTDCPRITSRTDWASDWNSGVTSTYDADPGYAWGQVTLPDGTIYKEFFATTGWQRGLTTQTENWSGGARKKWTTLQWTQDNTGVSYRLNPRVMETNVYDDVSNRRRTTVGYTSFGLPSDVYEYDADATTVLRRTHTDYNLSAVYTDRRIIGLPSAQFLYDGANTLFSKVDYQYDLGGGYQVHQGPPVEHDTANYGSGFVQGRGNLNKMRRWDVTDPNNASLASEYETGYNTSGSVIFTRDPLDHQTSVSYADSFSDGQNNRNTYAYPTTVTDPDTFSSTVQYNYDFGAVTRTQDPKGAAVTRIYDAAGRIERTTNMVNGAYTRYVYAPNQSYVQSFTTINDLNPANEFYSITAFDGHDRVRGTASDHPTSVSQYKAQKYVYDVMGRLAQQTNPTEITVTGDTWIPAGDDAVGWVWSYQSYDWKGRLTLSTDQAGTTKEILYGGCGCAGGQVVVTRDEVGRRQKMTYDILGRLKTTQVLFTQPKDQPLDGNGAVYSTTTNTYNVRDQVTNVNVRDDASGVSQNTQMVYDGHGRLKERWLPIYLGNPQSATPYDNYEYYGDDTLMRATDPRGASATYGYNNRRLVTSITYFAPSGVMPTPNVTYDYDQAGNRTLMIENGAGRTDYFYDTLSRLEREDRQFFNGGPAGLFTLRYAYNLAGNLTSLTDDRFGTNVTYNHNKAGELISVTGSGWSPGLPFPSTYPNNLIKYRAWGGMKQLTYGDNGTPLNINYNSRLQITQFAASWAPGEFQYYDDGRVRFAKDLVSGTFDRSYEYDHVGRLSQALCGAVARGESSGDSPYKQTYQRDVWGNLIARPINEFWGHDNGILPSVYVNNRNQGPTYEYDVAGNVIGGPEGVGNYDAAGRKASSANGVVISESFDGDGMIMKRTQVNSPYSSTIYYIRSSVLGGNVVTEVLSSGQKQTAYAYANGKLLMKELKSINQTFWHIQNPITGGDSEGEYDPFGAITYFADPYLSDPNPTYETGDRSLYYDDANPFDAEGGCSLNGVPISCSRFLRLIENGAVQAQTPKGIKGDVIHLGGGRIAGRYGTGSHLDDEGDRVTDYQYFYGSFAFGPQAQRQQRGGGGNRNLQKKEKKEPCNPGFFNEAQTYNVNNDSVHNFTGSDINVGARVIYGEAAGSLAGGTDEETDALASVLYNRIGAKGFRGGVQQTFQGVAYAPKQFESVTTPGRTKKFDSSAPGDYQNLSPGECNDLRRAVDAIKRLLESGPKYGYLYNLGGTKGPGDVIGGSRFFVSRKF